MVGFSDDLGPHEYGEALQEVFSKENGIISAQALTERYDQLKELIVPSL